MKSAIFASAALAISTLGLVACSDEQATQADEGNTSQSGISVTDARLILPAVAGNPAAVYFTVKNDSERDSFIRAASVKGAQSAVLHQMAMWNGEMTMQEEFQIPIKAGSELKFEPGALHVMANDLDESLTAGGTAEVTLTFIGGKSATFPAEVRAAGDER